MAKLRVVRKDKKNSTSHSYFAVKAKNEIYYQMASIFKHASNDESTLAEKIIYKSMVQDYHNIFMENSL